MKVEKLVIRTKEQQATILKDIFSLVKSLLDESERAVVIIAAARLDADLEALLKHLLIPHPGGNDPLFEGDRMLGNFSAKINMAYRLGAIDNDFEHALQVLRKIRNDFAHQLDSESLSSTRQKSRLAILVRWAEKSDIYQAGLAMPPAAGKSVPQRSHEHLQFVFCTVCMVVMLHTGLASLKRVNVGNPLTLVPVRSAPRPVKTSGETGKT